MTKVIGENCHAEVQGNKLVLKASLTQHHVTNSGNTSLAFMPRYTSYEDDQGNTYWLNFSVTRAGSKKSGKK